jgi:UDP-N-acetylglucosamine/UDP-N-acetylgalactosamine diphosphorylase
MDSQQNQKDIISSWTSHGHGHIFQFLDQLDENEKNSFFAQLEKFDISETAKQIDVSLKPKQKDPLQPEFDIEPVKIFHSGVGDDHEVLQKWTDSGLDMYAKGQVALLVMAGGQGTRLGTLHPKGTFEVGLLSGKSLFQLQAEKILRLQQLIFERRGVATKIPWYIMLSTAVEAETRQFYHSHNYFGLDESQIRFFVQGEFPCVNNDGKILLDEKGRISTAPNGNGGIFAAMKEQGVIDDMAKKGIKVVASYIVDNILCKIGDPLFAGFTAENNLEIAVKVCPKAYPEERVGVVAMKNHIYTVLEYSEIDESHRNARDSNGDLVFSASHTVISNFNLDFLKKFCETKLGTLSYHLAKKAIPYIDNNGEKVHPKAPNGTKFELFSFDIFESAHKLCAFEIKRCEEFSPLKNSNDSKVDSPDTCRNDLTNLHKTWITNAGGKFEGEGFCEISPLVSYCGEGLESLKGKTITLPFYLDK